MLGLDHIRRMVSLSLILFFFFPLLVQYVLYFPHLIFTVISHCRPLEDRTRRWRFARTTATPCHTAVRIAATAGEHVVEGVRHLRRAAGETAEAAQHCCRRRGARRSAVDGGGRGRCGRRCSRRAAVVVVVAGTVTIRVIAISVVITSVIVVVATIVIAVVV